MATLAHTIDPTDHATQAAISRRLPHKPDASSPPPSCDAYTAHSGLTTANNPNTALYELTNGAAVNRRFMAAFAGSYNNPNVDKCCSICSGGSYAGVTYTFHSDAAGNNPASCASFVMQFIDSGSLGWCAPTTFSLSLSAKPY